MKKLICMLAFSIFAAQANATTLTFDDIPSGSNQNAYGGIPTYNGFNFSSTLNWIDLEGSRWNYGAKSGDFGLLNNYAGVGIITEQSGLDFTFDGLWAKKWATGIESNSTDSLFGVLEGYNDGLLVWTTATSLNGSYEYYSAQSGSIDELKLGFGNFFLVDDISLNAGTSVPEPTLFVLLGMALLGLSFSRRKNA